MSQSLFSLRKSRTMSLHYQTIHDRRKRQSGLSLVELMISMALSLLLMLGILQVFNANKESFEISRDLNDLQDNAHLALSLMAESIRMAGHWGGVSSDVVEFGKTALTVFPGACSAAWIFQSTEGLRGYEGATKFGEVNSLPSGCIDERDYQEGSDLLVVRYADSRALLTDHQVDNVKYAKRNIVRSSAGQAAYVFSGAHHKDAFSRISENAKAYNMLYVTHLFFLSPCVESKLSLSESSSNCVEEAPTLMRLTLTGNRFVQQSLVPGVEQMQFDYGLDLNNDHQIDEYLAAHLVEDWQDVLSVRISLIIRGQKKDLSINRPGKEYLMLGDTADTGNGFVVGDEVKHFRRKVYQREVVLRNRL
mgnify:CR=1 FL=1